MTEAPAGSLDRIVEALRGAITTLPAGFQSINAELLRPDTELALAVVLGVWAGLHFAALGWLEDMIAGAKGSMNLSSTADALGSAAADAAKARNSPELKSATGGLAATIGKLGPLTLQGFLQADQFGQLRSALVGLRSQLLTGSPWPTQAGAIPSPAGQVLPTTRNRSVAWWVIGGTAAVGLLFIGLARAPRRQN